MKILFISIPAFNYHEDSVSSVLERLKLTVKALKQLGHTSHILVPEGSQKLDYTITVPGKLHPNLENCDKHEYFLSPESCLMNMLDYARLHQKEYDYIISVAQDYMCLWSMPYFNTPFLVIPNTIGSMQECDDLLKARYKEMPINFGFLTNNQKNMFFQENSLNNEFILGEPFDKEQYVFNEEKNYNSIFWAGRIVEYKGLENVAKICNKLNKKLEFSGVVNDDKFLQHLLNNYDCNYLGILNRKQMSRKMSQSPVFFQLQNSPWEEAFGRTTAEALFSGVPVIAFKNGANSELITEGKDGFIVKDIEEAIQKYDEALKLSPFDIRVLAEKKFDSIEHAKKIEIWLNEYKKRVSIQ